MGGESARQRAAEPQVVHPWSQLEAGQKSYDEHIVCSLPAILSAAGIEVVAA